MAGIETKTPIFLSKKGLSLNDVIDVARRDRKVQIDSGLLKQFADEILVAAQAITIIDEPGAEHPIGRTSHAVHKAIRKSIPVRQATHILLTFSIGLNSTY